MVAFGAVGLSFAVLVFLGAMAIFFTGGAQVTPVGLKDLPATIPLCEHFDPTRLVRFQVTDPKGQKHVAYHIEGTCPVSPTTLSDTYPALMQYLGWTLHDAGDGNLVAYAYGRREDLVASIDTSATNPNESTINLDIHTNADRPDDFPAVASPSPKPR